MARRQQLLESSFRDLFPKSSPFDVLSKETINFLVTRSTSLLKVHQQYEWYMEHSEKISDHDFQRKCVQQMCAEMWAHMMKVGFCKWFIMAVRFDKTKMRLENFSPYHNWCQCNKFAEIGSFFDTSSSFFLYAVGFCAHCVVDMTEFDYCQSLNLMEISGGMRRLLFIRDLEELFCASEQCCGTKIKADLALFRNIIFPRLERFLD